jgi:predicted transposase YdaD
MGKQISQYDKILKENLEAIIPGLMENVLGIVPIASEELPDDIQHTKERKPDVLKKITDVQNNTYVLHLEFQVADEPEMVYRMAEYYIMLERKYQLPIRQFVIFLGSKTPQMVTRLDRANLKFDFPLISFAALDYRLFLRSNRPEDVLLSILADFSGEPIETVLKQIVQRVEETSRTDFSLRKHVKQLRVLAQLRNLGIKLKEAMDSIESFISPEKDVFYLIGEERGEGKAKERFVRNLLTMSTLAIEQIASVAEVSVEFVEQVRQKITDEQ